MEINQFPPVEDKRVCLIYSGGLDSTVLLYNLLSEGKKVSCLSFNYGQKHAKELLSARSISNITKQKHFLFYIPTLLVRCNDFTLHTESLFTGSSQTDSQVGVPEGHYAEASMKKTIVPNRNMIMLSLAAAYCTSRSIRSLYYAAHSGDHAIYPDCRPAFVGLMRAALQDAEWEDRSVKLEAPFLTETKASLVTLGRSLNVPFERTWSCYQGGERHCGRCGTCTERKEAFQLAGISDPTIYDQYITDDDIPF